MPCPNNCRRGPCPECSSQCRRCGCACDGVAPEIKLQRKRGAQPKALVNNNGKRKAMEITRASSERDASKIARTSISEQVAELNNEVLDSDQVLQLPVFTHSKKPIDNLWQL